MNGEYGLQIGQTLQFAAKEMENMNFILGSIKCTNKNGKVTVDRALPGSHMFLQEEFPQTPNLLHQVALKSVKMLSLCKTRQALDNSL